jgi:hypothetical protein
VINSINIVLIEQSTVAMAEASESLSKVDSAASGLSSSAKGESAKDAAGKHRRTSSSTTGVYNINDLGTLILCCFLLGTALVLPLMVGAPCGLYA